MTVGDEVGLALGANEGRVVGDDDVGAMTAMGARLGVSDGLHVGAADGAYEGLHDGFRDGCLVGWFGTKVGRNVGRFELHDGSPDATQLG